MADMSCVAIAGLLTAMSSAVVMAPLRERDHHAPASLQTICLGHLTADENKQAIDDLAKKGETQDAEQKIAQSR